jgi:hypothetical protein
MEALDEHLFDVLLSFLTPTDALCLGGVSKSLRDLAGESPRWKEWCEKACPALMTSPAKELVAHFEKEYKPDNGPAFYRGLFLKMNKARGYQSPRFELQCETGSGPDVGEFLSLMDVFSVDGECIASCSAASRTLEGGDMSATYVRLAGRAEFTWSSFLDVEALRDSETILDKYVMEFYGTSSLTPPQLSLTWRLMHKPTLRLLTLLERAPLYIFAFNSGDREMIVGGNRQEQFPAKALALQTPKVHSGWITYDAFRWLKEQEAVECLRRAEATKWSRQASKCIESIWLGLCGYM